MRNIIVLSSLFLLIISCRNEMDTNVGGIYIREWSVKVNNLNTRKLIGIGRVKDTIFVKREREGFEISNNRWRLNDYDDKGWHKTNEETMYFYPVVYNSVDSSFFGRIPTTLLSPIFFNSQVYINSSGDLYKSANRTKVWKKVVQHQD